MRDGAESTFDALLAVIAVLFTAALVVLVANGSHFFGDDFVHFHLAGRSGLWEFVLTPIDVHRAPFHRLVTYGLFEAFPLEFAPALAVLVGFHLASLAYLFGALQLLHRTPANAVLVALCATSLFLVVPLAWWSSGLHRFPYLVSVAGSLFHWLRWRRGGRRADLAAVWIWLAIGLGFYAKALLIPFYLVGVEVCLADRGAASGSRRLRALHLSALSGAALIWFALQRAASDGPAWSEVGVGFVAGFAWDTLKILGQGLLTFEYQPERLAVGIATAGFWLVVCAATVAAQRRNAVVWGVAAAAIVANAVVIALSPRAGFGREAAYAYRYYYELVPVVVVFLAIAVHAVLERRGRGAASRRQLGLAALGVALYASIAFAHSKQLLEVRYAVLGRARSYVENLVASTRALRPALAGQVVVVDGEVPPFVLPLVRKRLAPQAVFLEIFGITAAPPGGGRQPTHHVTRDGIFDALPPTE